MAAIPGAIGMFASVIYQFIDAIFVSRALGQTAFAAVNLAFPFVIASFAVSDMIAVGSAVLISIRLGKKDIDNANRLFTNAVLLILAVTAIPRPSSWMMSPSRRKRPTMKMSAKTAQSISR